MRIGIIGAGALGSVIGGTLAEAGNDVLLVNRNRAHVDTIDRCRRRHILAAPAGNVDDRERCSHAPKVRQEDQFAIRA